MFRIDRLPGEFFHAEQYRAGDPFSWRVIGSRGTVEVSRLNQTNAEQIADAMNTLPVKGPLLCL